MRAFVVPMLVVLSVAACGPGMTFRPIGSLQARVSPGMPQELIYDPLTADPPQSCPYDEQAGPACRQWESDRTKRDNQYMRDQRRDALQNGKCNSFGCAAMQVEPPSEQYIMDHMYENQLSGCINQLRAGPTPAGYWACR